MWMLFFHWAYHGPVDKYWVAQKQKHKKQPFADASASHLPLRLWHVWFQAEAWISHTTPLTPPSVEVGGIGKRIKTARLRRKTKPGRDAKIRVRVKWLIFNILSQLWVNVKYHIFTMWLCGWGHGNSFPMTQSAQSHRQMRSIPHCSKAVFYVFVFDYIHDSATMYNHCPSNFPLSPQLGRVNCGEGLE